MGQVSEGRLNSSFDCLEQQGQLLPLICRSVALSRGVLLYLLAALLADVAVKGRRAIGRRASSLAQFVQCCPDLEQTCRWYKGVA